MTKASSRTYNNSPKGKLKRSAYYEAHKVEWNAYNKQWQRLHRKKSGYMIRCATELCKGHFLRTRFNGHRLFCDSCRKDFGYRRPIKS